MFFSLKKKTSIAVCSLFLAAGVMAAPSEFISIWNDEALANQTSIYPAQPQGGTLRMGGRGSFDNFNPFSPRGMNAGLVGLTYETLGEADADHEFIMHGVLAESFDVADDRGSMVVKLRKEARFSDGHPVTADDLVWTFNALMTKASPTYRNYYREVDRAEKVDDLSVRFVFKNNRNRELPLIVSQLPVLPSYWWKTRDIAEPQNDPMPGSGPYKYDTWRMGQHVRLVRDRNWWGANLKYNRGYYNFDDITLDYFRDSTVMREAFFAGDIDFFFENTIKDWKLGYDVPPVNDGRIQKAEIPYYDVFGMSGVFLNTRNPVLADKRVREALGIMFDFPRANRAIFFDSYQRTESFWSGTDEFQASKVMTPEERRILESLPGIDPEHYEKLPVVNRFVDKQSPRKVMRESLRLFKEAGWTLKDGVMRNKAGEAFKLSFIMPSPTYTRIFSSWVADLKRIGVTVDLLPMDHTQYFDRVRHFDFDMIVSTIGQSSNPGNEQRYFWGSKAADQNGTRNYTGIKNAAVDALIEQISTPASKADLTVSVKVLDRILRNEWIVIPGWTSQKTNVAWWKSRLTPPDGKVPDGRHINIFAWHATELDQQTK